jgi:cell wall-associated NlpC family hydrolase
VTSLRPDPSHRNGPLSRRQVIGGLTGLAAAAAGGTFAWHALGHGSGGASTAWAAGSSKSPSAQSSGGHQFERQTGPDRTVVRDANGAMLATFTDGARTAVLTGPSRTFSEPSTTSATVTTDAWVRVLPAEWQQGMEQSTWFKGWFPKALGDTSPDVFAVAFQYSSAGAPDKFTSSGLRYAGRAHFGPRNPGVVNELAFKYHDEKSDFYDYLGIPWTFADGSKAKPVKARYGDVDCSGFQRLLWGYRMGIPMHNTNSPGAGLPRRAFAIAAYGPGKLLIPNTASRPTDLSILQPGDLLFFAIIKSQPNVIDHVGFYLGVDDAGHPRFYSSRSAADGPTMGDLAGRAVLDGNDFYARGLRAARRL